MSSDPIAARVQEALDARTPEERAADEAVMAVPTVVVRPNQQVVLRPETAYSSKPGVGKAITLAKRVLISLEGQVLDDLVSQFNAVLATERAEREDLEAEVARLRARVRELAAAHERSEPTG